MDRQHVVASLGMASLRLPARVRSALKANDRLKLYLTLLRAAAQHARTPHAPVVDLMVEIAGAGVSERSEARWLQELPATASAGAGQSLCVPELPRLAERLQDDLATMATPLLEDPDDPVLCERVQRWRGRLAALAVQPQPVLNEPDLMLLTQASPDEASAGDACAEHASPGSAGIDSLPRLAADLHQALSELSNRLTLDSLAGAHAWRLGDHGKDAPRVEAFMRGLLRTRALMGDQPGLDTTATRQGSRLVIHCDIGAGDIPAMLIEIDTSAAQPVIGLTYSDQHRQRFEFFQRFLVEVGAVWSEARTQASGESGEGRDHFQGHARLAPADEAALHAQLEGIGERLVFLIDWNRARKRLLPFVGKRSAVAVLEQAARLRVGHCAWLTAGAERLVWRAMARQDGRFGTGERLDAALGADAACNFLVDVLAHAWQASQAGASAAAIDDTVCELLSKRLRVQHAEWETLAQLADMGVAMAQQLCDTLSAAGPVNAVAAQQWVDHARSQAAQAHRVADDALERVLRASSAQPSAALHPSRAVLALPALPEDGSQPVVDALARATFQLSLLVAEVSPAAGGSWPLAGSAGDAVRALAAAALTALQAHAQSVSIARAEDDGQGADGDGEALALAQRRVRQQARDGEAALQAAQRALGQQARQQMNWLSFVRGDELCKALAQACREVLVLDRHLSLAAARQAPQGTGD